MRAGVGQRRPREVEASGPGAPALRGRRARTAARPSVLRTQPGYKQSTTPAYTSVLYHTDGHNTEITYDAIVTALNYRGSRRIDILGS